MTIEPDDKDWTWILERPCPECGFDAASLSGPAVAPLVRANAGAWCAILRQAPDVLRRRPRPDRWSPLEYGCHVRDVYELFTQRLHLMLTADQPTFANWDQDATAAEDHYAAQDPAVVATQLAEAAEGMAAAFESVTGSQWERRGHRSDGATFSVLTFGRYMAHDPVHHLFDVRADLGDSGN